MLEPLSSLRKGLERGLEWIRHNTLGRLRKNIEDSDVTTIARRYFVMNAFDGALTMLGVILGAYVAGVEDPRLVIGAGVGGCLAMAVSGFCGTYMTERAERIRRLKRLENAMLVDLNGSMHERSSLFASVFAALVDGLSPAMSAMMSILPFVLSLAFSFPVGYAFLSSVLVTLAVLFGLGVFLGRVAKENLVLYGLLMVGVGTLTALLIMFIGIR